VTTNQWHAASLAAQICQHMVDPADLSDHDWHLLLLAADLNSPQSLPLLVCCRVLDQAARGVGYFEDTPAASEGGEAPSDQAAVQCPFTNERMNGSQAEGHSPHDN